MTIFTAAELEYLFAPGRLARLATVDAKGAPQNNPVGCRYNAQTGTVDIYGRDMGNSRKFRNLAANNRVALVIDDLKSMQPWVVRGIEIRGRAEAVAGEPAPNAHFSAQLIRVYPEVVFAWGIDADAPGMVRRVVRTAP